MKALFPILIFAALGYLGFVISQNHPRPAPATPAPEPLAIATPVPTPVAVEVSPTPTRNLAPEGTYFLLQRVSINTDSAIIGIAPGTKVTLVKAGPPMLVTDGQNQFEVQSAQVTNDLDVAAQVFYADRNAQTAINEMNSEQAAQSAKKTEADEKALQAKQRALGPMYAAPIPMSTGELNQAAKPVTEIEQGGNYRSAIH